MSFVFDGAMHRSPPEGWVVWWRRRTVEVCQQVIQRRHEEMLRELGVETMVEGRQATPPMDKRVRIHVPQMRAGKRKRRRR